MRILISGASVAGPVLAYWLTRYGFDVTVVERAPQDRKAMSSPVPTSGSRSGRALPNRTSGERDASQPQARDQTEPFLPNATNTVKPGEAEQP